MGVTTTTWPSRSLACLGALAVLMLLASALPVHAGSTWQPNGVRVYSVYDSDVTGLVLGDGTGGGFIFWSSYDIHPRIGRLGAWGGVYPGWPADGLSVTSAGGAGTQGVAAIAADQNGGVFLAWGDFRAYPGTTYLRHFSGGGTSDPAWPVDDGIPIHDVPNSPHFATLLPARDGGFYVAWRDYAPGSLTIPRTRIKQLHADGTLAPGWPAEGRLLCDVVDWMGPPTLMPDAAGGALVVWRLNDASGFAHLRAQRLDPDGAFNSAWPDCGRILSDFPSSIYTPQACSDSAGGAFAMWGDYRRTTSDPLPYDIYMSHVRKDGTLYPGWPAGGKEIHQGLCWVTCWDIEPDLAGGAYLCWRRDCNNVEIMVSRVGADGSLAPGWPADGLLVSRSDGYYYQAKLAQDGAGGVYVVMEDDYNSRVYVQHVLANGSIAPGWPQGGTVVSDFPWSSQSWPDIASDGVGGAIVIWRELRYPPEGPRTIYLYAQRFVTDGPVPTQLAAATAQVEPGLVRLRWYASEAASLAPAVERRTDSSEWRQVGTPIVSGNGDITYDDRSVAAATRYAYRLVMGQDEQASASAEVWVQTPGAFRFALAGARPNPAPRARASVALTLAVPGPARLDVLDLAGRRVASRDVGSLGVGSHVVRLSELAGAGPGVYWLSLTQGAQRATAKMVLAE